MEESTNITQENTVLKNEVSVVRTGGNLQKDEKYINFSQVSMLPDSSCDLIRVYNCDHFTGEQRIQFIGGLLKKIRYNGQLMICGVDPALLAFKYYNGDAPINMLNHIVENSMSFMPVEILTQILVENNFAVTGVSYNNVQYIIEAKRNGPKS